MICDKVVPDDKDDLPASITFVECDVGDKESFRTAFLATKEKFGKIDILVNNAGIMKETQYEGMFTVPTTLALDCD
jgi:NAD(P)-dependent dehydrogenase (short-subunit alcohol dehydrogenase family)